MAVIRPSDLPPAASVANTAEIPIDTGSAVEKATPTQLVDAAIPLASQAEAEAGADNAKRVTPLRVKQAIDAIGVSAANLASSESGKGAELVGFDGRTVDAKLRETASVTDKRFGGGADPTGGDDSVDPINAAVQAIGNRIVTAYAHEDGSSVSIHHSKNFLSFPPGRYRATDTILIDQGITLWAPGGHSSAVIESSAPENAIVINNDFTGPYDDPEVEENVRMFRWEGLALAAPSAETGVLIGTSTLRYVEFLSGQIVNVPDRGLAMGEAVYFVRLGNFEINNCGIGVFANDYCDLFTVEDRCVFTSNTVCAMLIEVPTFHIVNTDFEGNRGPLAQVIVNSRAETEAGSRAGLFLNNRWGPERTTTTGSGTKNPSPYDLAFTESGTGTIPVMSGVRVIANNFFSRESGHADQKVAPILLNARVTGFVFEKNIVGGDYSSGYLITTTDAAKCHDVGSIWNNKVDDIRQVHPSIRGLFKGNAPVGYLRVQQGDVSLTKYQTLYRSGYSAGVEWDGETAISAVALADSSTRANYADVVGIATYDTTAVQQDKPIWVAGRGATIQTTLDFTGQPLGTPVYKSGNGFSLTPPSIAAALIVGRTASAGTNGQMLVTFENAAILQGAATYDPASLADGAGVTTTVTATGAALGDFARATFSADLQGITLTAWVSAADTVSVRFQNETGGAIDLASGTLRVRVEKAG